MARGTWIACITTVALLLNCQNRAPDGKFSTSVRGVSAAPDFNGVGIRGQRAPGLVRKAARR